MLICALQLWAIFNAFTSLWKVSCSDLKHCRNHIFSCQVLFFCVAIVGVWSPALVPLSHYLFFSDVMLLIKRFSAAAGSWCLQMIERKMLGCLWHSNEAPAMAASLSASATEVLCLPLYQTCRTAFPTDTVKNNLRDAIPPFCWQAIRLFWWDEAPALVDNLKWREALWAICFDL